MELDFMAENSTIPPELALAVSLQAVVHVGKTMKCCWNNWLIGLSRELNNIVLILTLRDSSDGSLRFKLSGKFLSLDCVRKKDRMVVESIVRLTRPQGLDLLAEVKLMAHSL